MSEMMWRIWSHERQQWWAAKCCGYTPNFKEAGVYTLEESTRICTDANFRLVLGQAQGPPEESMVPFEVDPDESSSEKE